MKKYRFTSITQPVGKFYMSKMLASDLIPISQSDVRTPYNSTGIQRLLSQKRVSEIAEFCEDKSAMFPTPIIISAKSSVVDFYDEEENLLTDNYVELENGFIMINKDKIKDENLFFSIVDGQHRLAGIETYFEKHLKDEAVDFELSVLFIFDTENYEDAKIFSAINRHQKPVSKSLVYDLYGLSDDITVEKFAHEIVDRINSASNSRMKNQVKMLGYKTDSEIVSQATLVEQIIPLVSKNIQEDNKLLIDGYSPESNKDLILREYLIKYQIDELSELLINYLNAWIKVLKSKDLYQKALQKTVGFMLAFKVFKYIFVQGELDLVNSTEQQLIRILQEKLNFNNIVVDDIASSKAGVKKAFDKLTDKTNCF